MGRYVHGTWGFSCVRSPVGNPRGLWVVFLLKSWHGQQEMWSSYSLCLLSSLSFPSCIRVCFTDPGAPGEQQGSPAIPERADRFSLNTSLSTASAREATTAPLPPQQLWYSWPPSLVWGPVHPLADGDSGCVSQVSSCTAQRHLCLVICIQLVFNQRRGESEYLMPRRCWCHSLGSLFQWVWLRVGKKKSFCCFFPSGSWFKV